MDIHELFEKFYADQFDTTIENVRSCRMGNDSYNNLCIGRAFRMFRAGYYANTNEPVELLGYLSHHGIISAGHDGTAAFKQKRSANYCIPVFTKGKDK